jgi:hypothetical protein
MKAVAYTAVHIERITEVEMAKTVAVFAERLAVRDVQCVIEAENWSPKKLTGESSTIVRAGP